MDVKKLIRETLVDVDVEVEDWQGAIRAAGKLMVKDGAVEERFVDAMIRVAKEFGPYIVVAPGIALPHARPEDGVIEASIAILRLKTPVNFGNEDNDPVYLVVALAAVDQEQHIDGLRQLAFVLGDQEKIKAIKAAMTKDELLQIFWNESSTSN
jgi:mannitol/fructose-specific phosphotransferase system IIA component (Ntr-type)